MKAHRAIWPSSTQCRVLDVSSSGYYAWLKRPPSKGHQADAVLGDRIEALHRASTEAYGRPRIQADLRDENLFVSDKRVARLMRERHIQGASRRKAFKTTIRDDDARPAPDLVNRKFTASAPDQLWVADITYVPTLAGLLFLAVVLDVCSRRVVGWAMATHMRAELVIDALDMAIHNRKPKNVIHHSDQGSQYTSIAFSKRCDSACVRPSMGSVGDCYDCDVREFQRHSRMRAARQASLRDPTCGCSQGLRVHRGLLQSASSAYLDRQYLADGVRAPNGSSRIMS